MNIVRIVLVALVYLCIVILGFKAYFKVNLGKLNKENKEVNFYIYISMIYQALITIVVIATLYTLK